MRTLILLLFLLYCSLSYCDSEGPPPLMQRVMSTIPDLPNAINGQMNGDSGALKGMISKMLGDGLLSQLVTDPRGVAQHMGFNLDDLNTNNSTDMTGNSFMQESKPASTSKSGQKPQFLDQILQSFTFSPPSTTTTLPVMLIDGNTVPPEANDRLIRRLKIGGRYATAEPPTTTTHFSPEQMAEMVASKLSGRHYGQEATEPKYLPAQEFARSYSPNLIDPKNIERYNNDLTMRRWSGAYGNKSLECPFYTPGITAPPPATVAPDPLAAPIDPTVNEVLTNMRTRGLFGMTVEEVKRLQAMLQTYEQTLQTNELLAKRKQLQVLQDELEEQRNRIDAQRKMEEELIKKERELEEAKAKMERQLRDQLSNWHRSFNPKQNGPEPPLAELAELGLAMPPASQIPHPPASFPISISTEEAATTTTTQMVTSATTELPLPPPLTSVTFQPVRVVPQREREFRRAPVKLRTNQRYQDDENENAEMTDNEETVTDENEGANENYHEYRRISRIGSLLRKQRSSDDEFYSACECETISLDRMKGAWTMVLASADVVDALERRASVLLNSDQKINLNCTRFEISASKQSRAAQDARIMWEFRIQGSRRLNRFRGSALSMDHKSVRIQFKDNSGELNNIPGNCRDAALLVRDPERFFDNPDRELEDFLKNKMSSKELQPIDVISFADDCR